MTSTQHARPSPRHGGDLSAAIKCYGGQAEEWLDLSTGISPWGYPVPEFDQELWRTLPVDPTDLISVAASYYGCNQQAIQLTPGSQLAIRLLPRLIDSPSAVAIPVIGYQEHAHAWAQAGHAIEPYQDVNHLEQLVHKRRVEHAVVINPNNPNCDLFEPSLLREISMKLNGILVLDEAFIDLNPDKSLCPNIGNDDKDLDNLVIFRSIGKFFGLAGARVGFIISRHKIGHQLGCLFAPWSVNAAAQKVAEHALNDHQWQANQRDRIITQSTQLSRLVEATAGLSLRQKSQGLFSTIFGHNNDLTKLHRQLAEQRIWTRIGDSNSQQKNWLRFSLPGENLQKLEHALNSLTQ